jgi:putative Mg2+ transporter-C (MgtC) family protein
VRARANRNGRAPLQALDEQEEDVEFNIDWPLVGHHFGRIALAFALAFPVGWERGAGRASVGFRTFPVVAMASCGYALLVRSLPDVDTESLARLIQGLVAGIGFVGGGAILKEGGSVRGLVTAASIWNTGAIGAAVAFDRIEIAIVLSALNVLSLLLLTPLAPTGADDSER